MSNSYPHYINHFPSLLSVNRPHRPLCPMEFSSYNIKPTISLSSFYLIILSFATIPETHVTGSKACNFPAIFNFGDSNSDTGGYSTSYYRARPPYGKTYFHMPVGRYSDGRLMIDFMGMFLCFMGSLWPSLSVSGLFSAIVNGLYNLMLQARSQIVILSLLSSSTVLNHFFGDTCKVPCYDSLQPQLRKSHTTFTSHIQQWEVYD